MYSNATIKRARTILANVERNAEPSYAARVVAEMQTRKPRTSTPAPRVAPVRPQISDRQRSMVGKLATIGQMEAINGYQKTLGLKTFTSLAEFRAIVGDMRDASILRADLKAQIYG